MSSFLSKLVAAALAILLLVGDSQASSDLFDNDGEKQLWRIPDYKFGSRKTAAPNRQDCIQGKNTDSRCKKIGPFRSLRSIFPSPPPSPRSNRRSSFGGIVAPPPDILY